ncbi:MAG TPA: hypothetical protein VGV87_23525 [Blastocatellia bacterium]|jgi:hypothetical protein|nr:hypothetical protein [Blastocatellia bacterium]
MKPNRLFSVFATLALFLTSAGFVAMAQQPASQSSKTALLCQAVSFN